MSENHPQEHFDQPQPAAGPFTPPSGPAYHQDPAVPPAYTPEYSQPQTSYYPPTPGAPQAPGATNVYIGGVPLGANGQPFRNGLGTAAMVLGIIGTALFWVAFVDFVCPVLALIFGWIGMNRVNNGTASNKGAAITGLVLGGISLIGAVIVVITVISFAATVSTYRSY